MAWTSFGSDKTGASTISAAELNTYLRDNLLALKAHQANTTGQHGINAATHITGANAPGMHIEGHRSAHQYYTGAAAFDMTFTWDNAFTTLTAVISTFEREYGGGGNAGVALKSSSNTGCVGRIAVVMDPEQWVNFHIHVIALGVD